MTNQASTVNMTRMSAKVHHVCTASVRMDLATTPATVCPAIMDTTVTWPLTTVAPILASMAIAPHHPLASPVTVMADILVSAGIFYLYITTNQV